MIKDGHWASRYQFTRCEAKFDTSPLPAPEYTLLGVGGAAKKIPVAGAFKTHTATPPPSLKIALWAQKAGGGAAHNFALDKMNHFSTCKSTSTWSQPYGRVMARIVPHARHSQGSGCKPSAGQTAPMGLVAWSCLTVSCPEEMPPQLNWRVASGKGSSNLSGPTVTVIMSCYTVALHCPLSFPGYGGVSQENRATPPQKAL